jgi:threonine dehydratase
VNAATSVTSGSASIPITVDDVREAARRIATLVHRTPLMTSRSLSQRTGTDLRLKAENL